MILSILITGCAGEIATYNFAKEGDNAYEAADYQTALEKWKAGLEKARIAEDKGIISTLLHKIGLAYDTLSQYQEALDYYKQALAIRRDIKNREGEASTLNNIGIVYNKLSQYRKALGYYQEALVIRRDIGDQQGEGRNLNNIGAVYQNLGQYPEALEYYQQALELRRELEDKEGESRTLNNIGTIYWSFGQYQQALEHYQQALTIRRSIGDMNGEGNSLNNIGGVYWNLGQYLNALDYYYEALNLRRKIGDKRGEASSLNNIALTNWKLGEYEEALKDYQQALAIRREIGDRRGEASTLNNIGVVYASQGQYQQALEYYQNSLTIRQEIRDKRGEGITQNYIGEAYQNLGQYQKAYNAFQTSIAINTMLGTIEVLWMAQRGLAAVEVQLHQPEFAIIHYEQAIETIEALRAGLTEKEHKLTFMEDKLYVYDELIELLQNLHQAHPDKGYDRKALEIFERKQGRVFLEEIGKSGARLFAGLPASVKQREEQLETQLDQIRQDLADERAKAKPNQQLLQVLEEQKSTLQAEQEILQAKIRAEHPDYYALRYPQPVALSELQSTVLQPGELILVYGVMEKNTLLWVIQPDVMQLYTLTVGEKILQEKINKVRKMMAYDWGTARGLSLGGKPTKTPVQPDRITFPQASHELYSLLIPENVRSLLIEQHNLNIVLSGPLYALPFEALLTHPATQPQDAHYLIEDIPISYLSSASLLKTLREAKARKTSSARYPVLAFAHPVYQLDPSEDTSTVRGLRSEAYRELLGGGLAELPETADEAEAVAATFNAPEQSEPVQLRWNASCKNVSEFNDNDRLDDYQYLLFAMHGLMPGEVSRLTQSALILSDNFLTMADVFSLKLNAKLVALSACNTAMGKRVRGEGVMGLTRAFMYAGTPAVAVTLWSVESLSAKALSIGMFQHLSREQAPAHALRASKLRMIRGEEEQHYQYPYYWAPYVVFGDGR